MHSEGKLVLLMTKNASFAKNEVILLSNVGQQKLTIWMMSTVMMRKLSSFTPLDPLLVSQLW